MRDLTTLLSTKRNRERYLLRGMTANSKPNEELGLTLIVDGLHQALVSFWISQCPQFGSRNDHNKSEDQEKELQEWQYNTIRDIWFTGGDQDTL